jgi:hypothetical protein
MTGIEIGIRLVGAFYVMAGIVAARQMVMEAVLDKALAGITLKAIPHADRLRARWMLAIVTAVFAGGALLAVLSILALPAFLVAAALQALYLAVVAPRLIDAQDAPDPAGRRATTNAFLIHLAATTLVAAATLSDRLRWPEADPWPFLTAGLGILAFSAHLVWRLGAPLSQARGNFSPGPVTPPSPDDLPERIRLMVRPFVLPFADHATGRVVPQDLAIRTFGAGLVDDILVWEEAYLDTIPPRKRMGGFGDPAAAAQHEAEGQALAARMAEVIGADRVVYASVGTVFPSAPERICTEPQRVKLMADYGCHPLWSMDTGYGGPIDPAVLGLSPALVADLQAWAQRYEDALDWDYPGACPADDGFLARHEAEGRALAGQLAQEFAAQGRDHIGVTMLTQGDGVVEIWAGRVKDGPRS